ncbi:g9791 [Coccomyxa elongata]
MGLPRSATKSLWPLVALTVISWIVELCGLLSLHRSCGGHEHRDWYSFAQLPHATDCSKVLRYLWWVVVLEFPLVVAIIAALVGWMGTAYNALARYRMALIGLLATSLALHMWAANVALNLADSDATPYLSKTEVNRARVTLVGFALTSLFTALLMIALGDDGDDAAMEPGLGVREPLTTTAL